MDASALPVTTATAPGRLGVLRTGLILAAVLGTLGLAFLLDIGFDGSGWDVIIVIFAILNVVIAVGTITCAILGWNGRRAPAIVACSLLAASNIPALPAFFLPLSETTAEAPGPLLAVIGIVLSATVITLILVGVRRAR